MKKHTSPYSELFKYLAISMMFSLIGFTVGQLFIPPEIANLGAIFLLVFLIINLVISLVSKKNRIRFTMNRVYIFTFINGIIIYPLINYYAYSLGINTVLSVFFGTILILLALSLYTKKYSNSDTFIKMGPVLLFTLVCVIVMSLINLFIGSSMIRVVISSISVVLFTLYILYGMSAFKYTIKNCTLSHRDDYAPFVINLYTDFINLFLNILEVIDAFRD